VNSDEQRKPLRLPPLPSQAPPHLGPSNNTSPSVSSTGCAQRCVPADAAADVWQLFHQVGSDSRGNTHTHTHTNSHVHTHMRIHKLACAHTHTRIHTHSHTHTCTHNTHAHAHAHAQEARNENTHAHAQARMCTHTHACTGTGWAKFPPGLVRGRLKYLFTGSRVTRGYI